MTALPADEPPVEVQDLQADISATLTDLDVLVDLVRQLLDTRQRGLGFLTAESKLAQDQLIRAEHHARVDRLPHHSGRGQYVGLKWMRATPSTTGTGHINTSGSGNPTAISVSADITFTLAQCARTAVSMLERIGLCSLHQLPADPTISDHIAHVRALVWTTPAMPLLTALQRELEHLVEDATFVVDGNDRYQLGNCPHCGDRTPNTLVVYLKTGLVRCERDARGHFQPCWCADPFCPCVNTPTTFRHKWQRTHPARADGWYALAARLRCTCGHPGSEHDRPKKGPWPCRTCDCNHFKRKTTNEGAPT